jgi:hypothetical protein
MNNIVGKQTVGRKAQDSARAFAVAAALGAAVIGATMPARADNVKPAASASASGGIEAKDDIIPPWADAASGTAKVTEKKDTTAPKEAPKTETKAAETKSAETKPAETKATETKPTETKPASRSFYPSIFDATRYSYGSFPIVPLLPGGGIVMSKDAGSGVNVAINNRAVRIIEMDISWVSGLVKYPHQATYMDVRLGMGMMHARADASFNDGQMATSWRAGTDGMFDGFNLSSKLALHHMWIMDTSGIDVSASVGACYSKYKINVPVKLAGIPAENRMVSDDVAYTPVGLDLGFPHLQGKRSPIRLEGIGASLIPGGSVANAYAAFSGNFSNSARLLLIPRVNDNFGAVSYSSEVRADVELSRRFLLMPGLIGGYTHQTDKDGTYMAGGFLEAGLGASPLNSSELGFMSMRIGAIGEMGGDGAISPMIFFAVKASALRGPIF